MTRFVRPVPISSVISAIVASTVFSVSSGTALAQAPAASTQGSTTTPPAPQTPAPLIFNVTVVGNTPLHGSDVPIDQIPAPVQTATSRTSTDRALSTSADFLNRRLDGGSRQRDPEQSVPAGRELSRLHGLAAARHAAGTLGLHGRRAPQPAVRRRRELGFDPAHRDLVARADARLESAVRAQHPRRRAVDPDQGRRPRPGHARFRRSTAATRDAPSSSSTAVAHGRRAELVRRRQSVRRGRLARRFAVARPTAVRQARLAAAADRREPQRRLRGQRR